jgi:serine/threonine protein kinase
MEARVNIGAEVPAPQVVGTVVGGRYVIERPIGRGSFAHTYLARDQQQDRTVALKILRQDSSADLKTLELFEREAAVLRSLRHDGIPEVHDVLRDTLNGQSASVLVMQYVEGTSLAELIEQRGSVDADDVLLLFLGMLDILEYVHGRVPPVVHRDIKPGNVIVRPDGRPALVDFGSVRRVFLDQDDAGSTIVGTYGYMPYEQYMGQASPASDLYSLAATFLHLLTGRPPRDFMNAEGRIAVPDGLPGDSRLRAVITRLLKPNPAERFASARESRQAILAPVAMNVLRSSGITIGRGSVDLSSLGPVPRPLDSNLKAILDRLSPSALEMMDSSAKRSDEPGVYQWLTLAFFGVITFGILPLAFMQAARQRRRKLQRFLCHGHPTAADILSIAEEKTAFEEKLSKITYQFEVDGQIHRDADLVLPFIANRWQPGDRVQILYMPELDFDSVIVSAR